MFKLIAVLFCTFFSFLPIAQMAESSDVAIPEKKIVINIPNRSLTLYINGKRTYLFPVAVGTPKTKTPLGTYAILSKEINPSWIKPEDPTVEIPSGPENPLGYRWMQFQGNYGIHGTNLPGSVGKYVSNGCVRMREADVETLYDLVPVGTPVEIIYSRLIIEKNPARVVTYYVYPDEYEYQPLDVEKVNKALSGFGLDAFVSDGSIRQKLQAEDGQPTYIARVIKLSVNGEMLPAVGAAADNMVYLPAEEIAKQLNISLHWDSEKNLLTTPYGTVRGYAKKNHVYMNAMDTEVLYHLEKDWQTPELLHLKTVEEAVAVPVKPVETNLPPLKAKKEKAVK